MLVVCLAFQIKLCHPHIVGYLLCFFVVFSSSIILDSFALLINIFSPSATNVNNKGDNGFLPMLESRLYLLKW